MAVSCAGVIPSALILVHDKLPLPSVFKTWLAVPSDVGKVNTFATVKLLLEFIFNAGVVEELLPV